MKHTVSEGMASKNFISCPCHFHKTVFGLGMENSLQDKNFTLRGIWWVCSEVLQQNQNLLRMVAEIKKSQELIINQKSVFLINSQIVVGLPVMEDKKRNIWKFVNIYPFFLDDTTIKLLFCVGQDEQIMPVLYNLNKHI